MEGKGFGPRAPGDTNFFGRRRKRCGRAWKNAEGTRKIAEETGKMQKTPGSVGSRADVQGSQKSGRGALRKSVGRKARGADEAGRVGIGSDEKGKFVIPTNQGSGMTARLGPRSQQGFGPRARTGWRAAREAGQARRQVNTTGNKSCFGCPAPTGAEFGIRNEHPIRKHKRV